jgi:hypothetical protein
MDTETVEVLLVGGPHGVPQTMRAPLATVDDRIKIQHLNGYEHFHLDTATADSVPRRFHWAMRTRIAE